VSGETGINFLSYNLSICKSSRTIRQKIKGSYTTRRALSEALLLKVPTEQVIKFNAKHRYGEWNLLEPIHRTELYNASDEEIILTYNTELRGFANYYKLAYDVKHKLNQLEYMANYSLFKTLASKHKSKLTTVLKKLKVGSEFIHRYTLKGKPKEIKIFKLKHMAKKAIRWEEVDKIPNTL
jgi:RNA-directed DNA polymerase